MIFQRVQYRHIGQLAATVERFVVFKKNIQGIIRGCSFFFSEKIMRGFLENKQRTPWVFLMVSNNGKKQQLMNFIWKNGRFGMVSYFFLSQVVKHGGCLLLEDWDFQELKKCYKNHGDWHPEEGLHIPIPKRSSVLLGFFGEKTIYRRTNS